MSEKNKNIEILPEEIVLLAKKVKEEKFLKRYEAFEKWIEQFMEAGNHEKNLPDDIQLLNNMTVAEMAMFLNYFYWQTVENFVKPNFLRMNNEVRINHYQTAATIEYIIMRHQPFENTKGEPLKEVNARMALFITLQIIFTWSFKEADKKFDFRELIEKRHLREFITEHLAWLQYHAISHPSLIFSNMQTLRLLAYLFNENIQVQKMIGK